MNRIYSRVPKHALVELAIMVFIMVLSVVLFRTFDWDLQGIHFFYEEGSEDPWPVASLPILRFLYQFAPILTAGMGIFAIWCLIAGWLTRRSGYRRAMGLFLLASLLLGPGLVVNAIFKDNWERPRPRQVVDFGGEFHFHPLWEKGEANQGKSFPCGHCSVGFIFVALWIWWRRRRPIIGYSVLLFTLVLGFSLGIARMAAGAHFPSDVLWAFLFCWATCWALYYPILACHRIPNRAEGEPMKQFPVWQKSILYGIFSAAFGGLILSTLLATPFEHEINGVLPPLVNVEEGASREIQFTNAGWGVLIEQNPDIPRGEVRFFGTFRGHGLPFSHPVPDIVVSEDEPWKMNLVSRGWITDNEGMLTFQVNPTDWQEEVWKWTFERPDRVQTNEILLLNGD